MLVCWSGADVDSPIGLVSRFWIVLGDNFAEFIGKFGWTSSQYTSWHQIQRTTGRITGVTTSLANNQITCKWGKCVLFFMLTWFMRILDKFFSYKAIFRYKLIYVTYLKRYPMHECRIQSWRQLHRERHEPCWELLIPMLEFCQ